MTTEVLAAQGWFLGKIVGARQRTHWIGGLVLLVAGSVSLLTPAYVALLLMGAILATLAIVGRRT